MNHTKVSVSVFLCVFTLNTMLTIKADRSALVLEAFFHQPHDTILICWPEDTEPAERCVPENVRVLQAKPANP